MISIQTTFKNENENEIQMTITHDEEGVRVQAFGPTSHVNHVWTPVEAKVLRTMLELLEPAYKDHA
jgi:hypothetical protein